MTQHEDDIDFEFFEEEPPTHEEAGTQFLPRITRRPPGGPPRFRGPRAPTGLTPLLRLIGLIAFAILIIVLFVFWVQSCEGANKRSTFSNYMSKISQVGSASAAIGSQFDKLLTAPGETSSKLQSQLNGLAQHQEQVLAKAQSVTPPGQLRNEQQAAIEALQFRVSGLRGFADAFRKTSGGKTPASQAAQLLSTQAQRFVASDVVWADLFKAPSTGVLQSEGVTGVQVPSSTFLSTPELASASTLQPLWQRFQGASTGGTPSGLHGDMIVYTKALPSGMTLSQDTQQTIKAVPSLAFQVAVKNSGNFQEVSVKVTVVVQKTPNPLVYTQTIPIIQSGETKILDFKVTGQPPFGMRTSVKVDVAKVPGETNLSNNTAEYPVIFSLPA